MFDIWNSVLLEIEHSVEPSIFRTWFKNLTLISSDDGRIVIGAPNVFFVKQLSTKYCDIIKTAFNKNGVSVLSLDFSIQSSKKPKLKSREISEKDIAKARQSNIEKAVSSGSQLPYEPKSFKTNLNPRYTIDNFVIGSNNDLAVSVAKNVIESPGKRYNPFFLYGGPGLGKTHLVQAIGNELLRRNPKLKILYTPVSHFYAEFINLIRSNRGDEFAQKYQKLDVLIIDDFQFIVGKDRSQEEFFNIFNDLYQTNRQIIVTSDRLPSQIKELDERLSSRLAMAGAIDLQMPSFEDKCAILKSKAEFMGIDIEDEAIEFIAETVKTNIRDLESELSRLSAISELRGVSPLQLINDGGFISTVASSHSSRNITTPKKIIDRVAKYYGLSSKELCSKSRTFNIKNARQVAMYFLQTELSMSTNKIAAEVGLKDHTTVMHGCEKIRDDMKTNFSLRDQIGEIKEKIYE